VVPAIRENDPGACIIAPATSSIDIPFMESCFQQGLLDLIDGVSIHPYRSQQLGPETAADEYCALKTLIAHYVPPGKSMPIISGEWGYSATVVSPLQQGKYLARQWLSNMANDIPISIWYDWHDDGVDPNNAEHNFGTVNWDYSPKPAFFAMKTITHYFQDFEFLGRMDINNANDYFLIFFKNDQYKIALWTTAKEHEIELAEDLQVIHLVDFLGQAIAQPSASPIKISDQPIYMTVPAQVPHWLNRLASAEKLTTQESENISRVFLADISGEDFVDKLKASIKEGNKFEQQAAFMVLGKIAAKTIDSSLRLRLFHFILQNANAELIIKNSLQAVAAMASPQSKVTVDHLFENPVFKPDLTNYYLQMAFTYAKEKKFEAADSLLEKAVSFSRHRYSVDRILAKMEETGYKIKPARQRQLSQKAGFISSWWIAGPFPNENNQAEKIAYFPEDRIDFSQVQKFDSLTATWQPLELDEVFAIIPLAKLFGKKQQAAYAYAELNLPSAIPAKFKIGSNDGVVCWLNGKKVHENLVGRALTVDEDEVEVYLKAGVNKILLKIPNRGANWEACLRVCDEKGAPMDVGQFILNKAK